MARRKTCTKYFLLICVLQCVEKFIPCIVLGYIQTLILCQAMLIRLYKEIHIYIYFFSPEDLQFFEEVNDTTLKLLGSNVFRRFRKNAKSDYQLRHVCLSVRLPAWNNSAPTGRIFMKFDISFQLMTNLMHSFSMYLFQGNWFPPDRPVRQSPTRVCYTR